MTNRAKTAFFPPGAYWQPEWFEREKASVFLRNWVFAGFAKDVAKHNDYISFTVAGLPVIIRNMKGRLVAFRNICSHRYSQIHPEGCGNAMFRCPYHGWTYNAEGVPIGIPDNAASFGFDEKAKCDHALDAVALERVGNFLFVCVSRPSCSLREWLGKLFDDLEEISTTFDQNYGTVDQTWQCNWKIGLEITIEGYHMPLVHAGTFNDHIGGMRSADVPADGEEMPAEAVATTAASPSPPAGDESRTEYIGSHSFNTAPLSENSVAHLNTVAKRLRLPQSAHRPGYDHFLISPNLMIGVNGGTNVCIERYEPLSSDQTRVQCWLMTGTPADTKLLGGIIWQTIAKQWTDWTAGILGEDRVACEAVQRGVRYANHRATIGRCEERILHYQDGLGLKTESKTKAA